MLSGGHIHGGGVKEEDGEMVDVLTPYARMNIEFLNQLKSPYEIAGSYFTFKHIHCPKTKSHTFQNGHIIKITSALICLYWGALAIFPLPKYIQRIYKQTFLRKMCYTYISFLSRSM
jgi:hypothetical protein